jgi:hypothetical protein
MAKPKGLLSLGPESQGFGLWALTQHDIQMFQQLFAIIRNTFFESIRQPIMLVVLGRQRFCSF